MESSGGPSPEKISGIESCTSIGTGQPWDSRYAVIRYTMDFFTDAKSKLGEKQLSNLIHDLKSIIEIDCDKDERILQTVPEGFDILIRFAGRTQTDRKIRAWFYCLKKILSEHDRFGIISFAAGVYEIPGIFQPSQLEKYTAKAAFAQRFGRIDRNPFVRYYSDEDFQRLRWQRRLETQIAAAVDEHQLQVYLQPQYSLPKREIIGTEALVRWKHPDFGLIMPDDFIPLFEQNRFIIDMDFYMLEECCKILHRWHTAGFPVMPISLNFSRLQAETDDFLPRFLAMIEKYRIQPDEIRVEWTESAFATENVSVSRFAGQLRAKGFQIAVDDFGTGYSSLNALSDLPANIIKLDRRFLIFKENDCRHRYLLQQIIRTANNLKYTVLAEGVEFTWQAELLQSMGCEYVQGFLYGRPVPVSVCEKLIASQARRKRKSYNKPPGYSSGRQKTTGVDHS